MTQTLYGLSAVVGVVGSALSIWPLMAAGIVAMLVFIGHATMVRLEAQAKR